MGWRVAYNRDIASFMPAFIYVGILFKDVISAFLILQKIFCCISTV